ncbi:hypothetical protein [Microbacterium paraoxydans]|uniref:DUF4352 domain-containing protein n=1 Tax=Microbacterium paraoxydans TaxID=199592 RepID=A0ABS5IM04_9MICO|nr:hypothetical protein [Microbacterium paraoxydans]MBS0023955.1 hypothetical protein [Microbacterium paraoxydans]
MTTTPPEGTAPHGRSDAAAARARVLGWARRSIDLIPTPWLLTAAGALLLAGTAVFGGLEAAAVDPTPEVAVGETYTGSDLELTVVAVELRDDRGQTSVFPDEEKGERVLVVTVDAVNTFHAPRGSTSGAPTSAVVDGIRIDGVEEKGQVSRADDGRGSPTLQPDVPARLLLAWLVGPDDYREGDEITLTLPDSTHAVGSRVIRGDYWTDVRVGATLTTSIAEGATR